MQVKTLVRLSDDRDACTADVVDDKGFTQPIRFGDVKGKYGHLPMELRDSRTEPKFKTIFD